jgi:L1 cell adhesion molecule like protein
LQLGGKRNVLIFDLGGGTFDVSILTIENEKYQVKATAGNTHLGGEDFDNRMVDHFVQEFKRKYNKDLTTNKLAISKLRTACERAKRMLSDFPQNRIEIDFPFEGIDFYTSITRATFELLNGDLFRSTMKAVEDSLREAKMVKEQIHDIVLVGGSTRIPMVQELLQDFFNVKELNKSIISDEAVAYGATVQAAILAGEMSMEFRDLVLLDVNPLSMGIRPFGKLMSLIIKRNTPIPTKQTQTYYAVYDIQEKGSFAVYELELAMAMNKTSLGKFELTGIPLVPSRVLQIEMTFNIDPNGMLNVSAVENSTQIKNKITFTSDTCRLSKEEIEAYRAQNALRSYCLAMKSSVEGEKLKNKISESDKDILHKCNEVICWVDDNQHARKAECESRQKELESVRNQSVERMDNYAGQSLVTAE